MQIFYEVRELNIAEYLSQACAVIRLSFADIANEFHLTPQNCPNSPAFLSDAGMAESLLKPGMIGFGAFQKKSDALLGFAAIWPKTGFEMNPKYELTRLCVLPEHRHAGLGARLLQEAVQAAKAQGARKIEIGIIAENERLKAWYEKHGFIAIIKREYRHLPFAVCELEREV